MVLPTDVPLTLVYTVPTIHSIQELKSQGARKHICLTPALTGMKLNTPSPYAHFTALYIPEYMPISRLIIHAGTPQSHRESQKCTESNAFYRLTQSVRISCQNRRCSISTWTAWILSFVDLPRVIIDFLGPCSLHSWLPIYKSKVRARTLLVILGSVLPRYLFVCWQPPYPVKVRTRSPLFQSGGTVPDDQMGINMAFNTRNMASPLALSSLFQMLHTSAVSSQLSTLLHPPWPN